jgi:hypothetical protein
MVDAYEEGAVGEGEDAATSAETAQAIVWLANKNSLNPTLACSAVQPFDVGEEVMGDNDDYLRQGSVFWITKPKNNIAS